jgi:Bacterial SH3 domain
MTTTIKITTTTIKTLSLLLIMNLAFACSNAKTPSTAATMQTAAATTEKKTAESITINGLVTAITFGKDGYTANVETQKDGVYAALVSSANMGGPDKYESCEVGYNVSFKGEPSGSGDAKGLIVKEIISISAEIYGTVKAITNGKDGYTAVVETDLRGNYDALVSISNVGGPDKYKSCKVGDKVNFKGVPSITTKAKRLMVKEILDISVPESVEVLAAKYLNMKSDYFCWQTSKVNNLHTKPSADSKVIGKHFQGENLQVLETKIIGKQLWVKVTYSLTIKGGYEDRFADGRVTPSGSPTGWIGGAETAELRSK